MTDRGRSPVDASFACPFVAFEDDRDARSDVPDPRHRCFAELRPAPRAIAHQERYCLSPGFAACPTFVDWAQREAARVRRPDAPAAAAGLATTAAALAAAGDEPAEERGASTAADDDEVWPRRPEREWAAPPPWAPETGEVEDEPAPSTSPPPFLADREPPAWEEPRSGRPSDAAVAGAAAAAGAAMASGAAPARPSAASGGQGGPGEEPASEPPMRRYGPAAKASPDHRPSDGTRPDAGAPSWETPRRYEAYPTLRSPRAMPNLSPLILAVGALILGALVLFIVPPLLLGLGGGSGSSTPTPSANVSPTAASPTVGASPSVAASAATTTYTVKSGDTMSKIANKFGVPLDALIAANKGTIKDPNKLSIGDTLVIPTPAPSEIAGASPSPSP